MEPLTVVGDDSIRLSKGTFAWVQITHFRIPLSDDRSTLAALIESPGYDHDYASPFRAQHADYDPPVHGRWPLSAITADGFRPTTLGAAVARIRSWAETHEQSGPGNPLPPQIVERLEQVHSVLRCGTVYTLVNPGEEHEREMGWITGVLGFHEFVVIDRSTQTVHVVVASDD